jgi:inorganic triphosphatase YgiF
MAKEVELKLTLTPAALAKLKRHPFLRSLQQERARSVHLENIYFDTPDYALQRARMALRLRRSGKQWLQTLKGGGGVQAGLHQRNEWEMPVAGEQLELDTLKAAGAHFPKGVAKHLQAVFRTDFSRSIRELRYEDARIELCMDQGEVSCATGKTGICELELELLEGPPVRLFQLALELHDIVPFELEAVSKAERGYRLIAGQIDAPAKARSPSLAGLTRSGEVLQALCAACLQHLQANLSGAINGDDPEYLHQLRIAFRRLRTVLSLAASLAPDETLAQLRQEFAALGRDLGVLRDQDAFITETLRPLSQQRPVHAGLRLLLKRANTRRNSSLAEIRTGYWQWDVQHLILRLALWLHGDYWWKPPLQSSAKTFCTRAFQHKGRRFLKHIRRLDPANPASLHRLRILTKKTRYFLEMFEQVEESRGAVYKQLVNLQTKLGEYNDTVNVEMHLVALVNSRPLSVTLQEACTLVLGWNRQRQAALQLGIPKLIRRTAKSLSRIQS